MDQAWLWAGQLSPAGLLGGLVGMERELRGHPAGVRTQAVVALAAALLTIVGGSFPGEAVDTSRIASQVVTGIGFVGAGVIIKNRGSVKGLTTAATLWLSAAVGIAVGAGMIVPALLAAALAILLVFGLSGLKPRIHRKGRRVVEVEYVPGHGTFGPLIRSLQDIGSSIEELQVDDALEDGPVRPVSIRVSSSNPAELQAALENLLHRPEVRRASVGDL